MLLLLITRFCHIAHQMQSIFSYSLALKYFTIGGKDFESTLNYESIIYKNKWNTHRVCDHAFTVHNTFSEKAQFGRFRGEMGGAYAAH